MKKVYTANTLSEAQIMKTLLHTQGIEAELFGQYLSGAMGELPASYPELWVDDESVSAAQQLIEKQKNVDANEEQKCSACGELNPQTFEVCWSCQNAL